MPLSELANTDTSGMCRFELEIELLACCCCIVIMYILRRESGEVEIEFVFPSSLDVANYGLADPEPF
jgi:hypothetical protein